MVSIYQHSRSHKLTVYATMRKSYRCLMPHKLEVCGTIHRTEEVFDVFKISV